MRFDVKVRAPGTLRIDNNLATLQARADLTLQGTYDAPVLLGRAEIDRGRVYFQGNTYVIRRGSIDFANPQKIDPLFDVEAEARVRSYNVVLKTQGTLDRVTPTLTSDPPLSTVAILSLLAGAEESEVERTSELRDRSELAATGAATLAAGRLSEQFGLERRASRLGLSRFSIDPTVGRPRRIPQLHRPPHRRQAAHPRPLGGVLPGAARQRRAPAVPRVQPLRQGLHPPHPRRARRPRLRPPPPPHRVMLGALGVVALLAAGGAGGLGARWKAPTADVSRYVAIEAGRPLDPEQVRRTVELLHATGAYEDVVVEEEDAPGGSAVTVRLRGRAVPDGGGGRGRRRSSPRTRRARSRGCAGASRCGRTGWSPRPATSPSTSAGADTSKRA